MWGREEEAGDGRLRSLSVAPEMPLSGRGVGLPMPAGDRERRDRRTQIGGTEEQKGNNW